MDPAAAFLIPPSLHVEALLLSEDGVTIRAVSETAAARCPLCGEPSDRVHSRYARTLADLPWACFAVRVQLRVRRFFCANPTCPRTIFAERLAGIAEAFAHRTERQRERLTDVALALGGEAGARLAAKHGMPVSPDTLLRLIRDAPEREVPTPAVLGVDDWAIHKGLTYGTILVDLERHRPVDVLPDRSGERLAAWLKAHPGVEIIARDRGGAYAEGARDGAPEAIQVADRWHLVDNLADVLEEFFRGKGLCLKAASAALVAQAKDNAKEPGGAAPPPSDAVYQGKRRHPQPERWRERADAAAAEGVARRRVTYDQARALHAGGVSVAQIARTVGASRMTVYKYLREGPPQRKRHSIHGKQRVLEPYEPYLLRRWQEGCRMATVLWREIRAQGHTSPRHAGSPAELILLANSWDRLRRPWRWQNSGPVIRISPDPKEPARVPAARSRAARPRRDRPRRPGGLPQGASVHADARRIRRDLRGPGLRPPLPRARPTGRGAMAARPGDHLPVRREPLGSASGGRRARPYRLEIRPVAGADRSRLRASVLCEFRTRLVEGDAEELLLRLLLARFRERGLLKARGRQRTDSTHVLGAIRALNRLELVTETMRHALEVLSAAAPAWLRAHAAAEWVARYGRRAEEGRLPAKKEERQELAATIGADGTALLTAAYASDAPQWLREVPAVEILRRVWVQNDRQDEAGVHWRADDDIPPSSLFISSPDDPDAHLGKKGGTYWVGYKVSLTETCEDDVPNLITHAATTAGPVADGEVTPVVHRDLRAADLLPALHLVDTGFLDAELIATSERDYGVDLLGPTRPDVKWQAKEGTGFEAQRFAIDWEREQATCPRGKTSISWTPAVDKRTNRVIKIKFSTTDCRTCASRDRCIRSRKKDARRAITIRPKEQYEALKARREFEQTPDYAAAYAKRAGIEGTISQGVRRCGLRRSRDLGLAKTHLEHVLTAAAIDFVRVADWLAGVPRAQTRRSTFATLMAQPMHG